MKRKEKKRKVKESRNVKNKKVAGLMDLGGREKGKVKYDQVFLLWKKPSFLP